MQQMPYATDGRGGGNAMPPYMQARVPNKPITKPVITPKASVVPGEVKQPQQQGGMFGFMQNAKNVAQNKQQAVQKPPMPAAPMAPPTASPQLGASGPSAPQTLYDYLKQDLIREKNSAIAQGTTDAESRGMFYGTPLNTSHGDAESDFLHRLGILGVGVQQNESQNDLTRLGIGANLLNGMPMPQGGGNGMDPATLQMLGSLFTPQAARGGPVPGIRPKSSQPNVQGVDNKVPEPNPYG